MAVVNDPVLSKKTIGLSDYTKITFEPDLSRFFVAAEPAESSGSGDKPIITSAHSAKDREFLIQNAMKLFEHVRVATAILRKEGYVVEPDNYLEGEAEDQVYIAGIRFIDLGRRSK